MCEKVGLRPVSACQHCYKLYINKSIQIKKKLKSLKVLKVLPKKNTVQSTVTYTRGVQIYTSSDSIISHIRIHNWDDCLVCGPDHRMGVVVQQLVCDYQMKEPGPVEQTVRVSGSQSGTL